MTQGPGCLAVRPLLPAGKDPAKTQDISSLPAPGQASLLQQIHGDDLIHLPAFSPRTHRQLPLPSFSSLDDLFYFIVLRIFGVSQTGQNLVCS